MATHATGRSENARGADASNLLVAAQTLVETVVDVSGLVLGLVDGAKVLRVLLDPAQVFSMIAAQVVSENGVGRCDVVPAHYRQR